MKQITIWLVVNSIFATAIYFGLYEGVKGAENIAQFIAWLTIVASFLLTTDVAVTLRVTKGIPFSVPAIVDIIFDISVVTAFVWFGWFWTAAFYSVHIVLLYDFRVTVEARLKELKGEK